MSMHAWNSCLEASGRPNTCRCAPYSSAVSKQSSAAPVMPHAMPWPHANPQYCLCQQCTRRNAPARPTLLLLLANVCAPLHLHPEHERRYIGS